MEVEKKHKLYSSLSLLCFNLFFVSLILVVCSYFSILRLDVLLNSDIIFGAGMFLGFISLVLWEKSKGNWEFHFDHKDKKKIKEVPRADDNLFFKIVPYLFLLMLLIIAANQFFKWEFVNAQMMRITILAITFGAITFWRNRDRVEKEIEQEKEDEEQAELRRANEFDSKFPRLSKLNLDYGFIYAGKIKSLFRRFLVYLILAIFAPFIFLIRIPYKFVKWMYKEGWGYSVFLIAIVILGFVLRIWNIFKIPYNIDEGIYAILFDNFRAGHFLPTLDSGAVYLRNFIYTYFSFLIDLFTHNTLFSIRFVSLFFGIGLIFMGYLFVKKLTNKFWAIFASLFLAINGFLIAYSIQGRHYMMMFFLYLLLVYILFYGNLKKRIIQMGLIVLSLALSLNYEFIFLILPLLFILWVDRKKNLFIIIFLIILSFFILQPLYLTKSIESSIAQDYGDLSIDKQPKSAFEFNLFEQENMVEGYSRLFFSLQPIFYIILFILTISTFFIKFFYNFLSNKNIKYIFFLFITELIFFSFVLIRNQSRYRGTLVILSIIIVCCLLYFLFNKKNSSLSYLFTFCILFFYLVVPINIAYPAISDYQSNNYSSNYHLLLLNFEDPLGFNSIQTNTLLINYSIDANFSSYLDDCDFIFTTDLYNAQNYLEIDGIINPYFRKSFSYDLNNKSYNVYNNLPFFDVEDIKKIISENKSIIIVADNRFNAHLTFTEINFIFNNFNMIYKTNSDYLGIINNETDNSLRIFKSK